MIHTNMCIYSNKWFLRMNSLSVRNMERTFSEQSKINKESASCWSYYIISQGMFSECWIGADLEEGSLGMRNVTTVSNGMVSDYGIGVDVT